MAELRNRSWRAARPFELTWAALGSALLCAGQSCTEPSFEADATTDYGRAEAGTDESTGRDASISGPAAMGRDTEMDAALPWRADGALPSSADGALPSSDAGATVPEGAAPLPGSSGDAALLPSRSDAAVAVSGDAAADLIAEWARPLIGTYAKRTVTFSYDDATNMALQTRNVDHSLARIADEGGELVLTIQTCSYSVTVKGETSAPLDFKNASQFAALRARLSLTAPNTFSSDLMLQHFGFDPARGTSCAGAARRSKFEEQTWISGSTCACYPTVLPADLDDCRVIDGDRDGLAGVTVRGPSPLGTTIADYLIVLDYSVKIIEGKIVSDRPPEWREVRAQGASCINAERDRCYIGNNELCPGASTLLLRLPREATCADLDPGAFGPLDTFPAETDCREKQAP